MAHEKIVEHMQDKGETWHTRMLEHMQDSLCLPRFYGSPAGGR